MTTTKKSVSAVDRLLAEVGQGYQLTDDIVISPPTRAQAEALANAQGQAEIMKVLFGEHYEAVDKLIDELPLAVGVKLMSEMVDFLMDGLPDVASVLAKIDSRNADLDKLSDALK